MSRFFQWQALLVCLFVLWNPVKATATVPDAPDASNVQWRNWFAGQIERHPDVLAARERMNAAFSVSDNLEQPLYNPELETEYEREVEADNFRIGVSQTIDWWDRQAVRRQQARFDRAAAKSGFQITRQQKIATSLRAIVRWESASELAVLAQQQERQLGSLLSVVQNRLETGDLGQLDAELTYLGLSQRLNDTAQAQARLSRADANVRELLPDWAPRWAHIPDALLTGDAETDGGVWLDAHPAVLDARAHWEAARQAVELARRDTKAEPTVGFNAGRSTEGNVAAVTLSLPLNVRNNFSALVRAATEEALAAEAHYRAVRQQQQAAISSAQSTLRAYQRQYERWQALMQGRVERSSELLDRQWAGGDMSTTEYLLALQQRAEGLAAGIELRTRYQLARIDWLQQTGQLGLQLAQSAH